MARKCNCSGFCGPVPVPPTEAGQTDGEEGVSRRDFISLASVGAAGALLAGPAATGAAAETPAELAAWKVSLLQPGKPKVYRSDRHTDARMHLGGVGTGNFEICADGQLMTWQLFNTLRDGNVPFWFGLKAGGTARMLQTQGGPDGIPRVKAIEMTGDYPIATLRYLDSEVPLQVEMRAFTPFAPLDTELSSLPLAFFVFRLHNPTASPVKASVGAFLRNPVGYDAFGPALGTEGSHPNLGGNINEILPITGGRALSMRALPMAAMRSDGPLHIATNLPAGAFNSPFEGRPETVTVSSLDALGRAPAGTRALVWLEDAPEEISLSGLKAAVAAARAGATLLFSGTKSTLLRQYASLTGGKPLSAGSVRPDILFEDFEGGYEKWTRTGTAFGAAPGPGSLPGQQPVSGQAGRGLVNTFLGGDDAVGTLISSPFAIERRFIRFLIGGGSGPNTQVRLMVDGKVARASSGKDEEKLLPGSWNVELLLGQTARLEIVDGQRGPWGHINVDQIEFSDVLGNAETLRLLDEVLPARFSNIRPLPPQGGRARVEFVDLQLKEGARRESASAGHGLIVRSLGEGRVVLADGPFVPAGQLDCVGARMAAYQSLAQVAGGRLDHEPGVPPRAPGFGTLALGALNTAATCHVAMSDSRSAWSAFTSERVGQPRPAAASEPSAAGDSSIGALFADVTVPPGQSVEVPIFLAWSYPNKYNGPTWMGCHYAQKWPDAARVARYAASNYKALRARTKQFCRTFYDSTLPWWLLDAVTSQMATIRHIGVVFRIANGDVYGWEGSNGCCDPTCTHVWGYVQNLARVFPELERDMRRIDFKHQQGTNGGVNNRTAVPSPPHPTGEHPFADGHCSTVLKAYREALNSPGDRWLREYWPSIKHAVEYLIARDAASSGGVPNGLLEDDQLNTYDEALHGVSGFIGSYYLAALRAGEEMAKRARDPSTAARFQSVYLAGRKNLVVRCWNGEYFQQDLPGYEKRGGEVGPGCMADQVIGQWWAHQLGLGYLLPKEMVQKALRSVFQYNWYPDLTGWKHAPRAFAGAKDRGLIICTWPKGGRPASVMNYSDEVWTGIEYQVAAHMLYEGMRDEAYAIVKGLRERYDGVPRPPILRNPWNEIECGGHYARAGASWSLLLALSGWLYDGITSELTLRPLQNPEAFKCFFTGPEGWGSVTTGHQPGSHQAEIHVVEGTLAISALHLHAAEGASTASLKVGARTLKATMKHTAQRITISPARQIVLHSGERLTVRIG